MTVEVSRCVCTGLWISWRWSQRHCRHGLAGQDAAELVFRLWPALTGHTQASCGQDMYSTHTHTHTHPYTWQGHRKVIINTDYKQRQRWDRSVGVRVRLLLGREIEDTVVSLWAHTFHESFESMRKGVGSGSNMVILTSEVWQSPPTKSACHLQATANLKTFRDTRLQSSSECDTAQSLCGIWMYFHRSKSLLFRRYTMSNLNVMCYVRFRAPAIKRMRGYFYFVLLIFIILLIRRAVCGNVWCLAIG